MENYPEVFRKWFGCVKSITGGTCKIIKEDKTSLMKFYPYDFIYIDGYWQNPGYFDKYRKELSQEFSPRDGVLSEKAINMIEQIGEVNSVAVHIRRGDYSTNWLIGEEFYSKAIILINEKVANPKFFIFCEDYSVGISFADKVKEGKLVTGEFTDIEEFFIMSACKNQIIANSTFSWWAAYLNKNPNAVIIAPEYKQWTGDYYLREWIKVNVQHSE